MKKTPKHFFLLGQEFFEKQDELARETSGLIKQ